jgi:hypothetical protein
VVGPVLAREVLFLRVFEVVDFALYPEALRAADDLIVFLVESFEALAQFLDALRRLRGPRGVVALARRWLLYVAADDATD